MKKILSILLATALLAGFGAVFASAATYQITFDANTTDATVAGIPAPMTKTVGAPLKLPGPPIDPTPTRTGFLFSGWATTSTGGVAYRENDPYSDDSFVDDKTLYAVWEATTYTVTFDGNTPPGGGAVTGLPAPVSQDKTLDLTLPAGKPACTGYDFIGWSKSPAGPANYGAGGSYLDRLTVTLYAIWEPNTYEVTFNGNAPTGSAVTGVPAAMTKLRGTPLALPAAKPACNGFNFQGWGKNAAGPANYGASGSYPDDAAVTLYAIWVGNTYYVHYDANGGSGAMADSTHIYGTPKTLTDNAFTITNNGTFAGWALTATGPVIYSDKQSVDKLTADPLAVVTLYAVWKYPNKTDLQKKIEELDKLAAWKYTAKSWAELQKVLDEGVKNALGVQTLRAARAIAADPNATQQEIDNALHELVLAQRKLESKSFIFSTKYESSILNWILFILAFGWIWMWF